MTKPYQGTTRPIVGPDPKYGRHGGYQGNGHQLTPVQKLARDINALYLRHIQRKDTMPDLKDVEQLIIEAVEEAEGA